jgi:hypothetical protein
MTRSNEDIWEERGSKWGGRFTRHPVAWSLSGIVAIILTVGALNFAFGWIGAATDVVSPANVKEQYAAVIEDWNAMEVAAENACGAANAEDSKQGPTFLEDPAFAYKAQYRHISVDYNRRQNNFFEAQKVGPGGYPAVAPSLSDMQDRVCRP